MPIIKQDTHFVSELDEFLQEWDKQHSTLSTAQQNEIHKHEKIAEHRDNAQPNDNSNSIWEDF